MLQVIAHIGKKFLTNWIYVATTSFPLENIQTEGRRKIINRFRFGSDPPPFRKDRTKTNLL